MLFHLTLKTSHSQFKKLPKIFTTKILCQPLPLFNFPLYFSSLSSFFLLFLFSPLFIPNVLNSSPPPAPGEDIENFIHPCFQSNTMKLVKQFTSPPPKVTKKSHIFGHLLRRYGKLFSINQTFNSFPDFLA